MESEGPSQDPLGALGASTSGARDDASVAAAETRAGGPVPRPDQVLCPHCGQLHPKSWSHCPNTGKPLTVGPALIGRVIAGRYEVIRLVGEGGMGAVYEAEHRTIGRRVALKRLHPELATDAHAVNRFQREARAAGGTGHEHVVDILDLGFAEDGAPYLVMELLAGESLAARLERERQLPEERAARIAGQVLSALEAVHARRVIHRDLKPDNIFLTRRGRQRDYVKVLDFGVSKIGVPEGRTEVGLTRTGTMVGTPHYMSPEQARGVKKLDHRVDLYAVGVILYECLSGQLPFDADNYHALLQSILVREPVRVDTLVSGVTRGLADAIHRALAKDPARRFESARAMWEALVPFGAEAPTSPESIAPPSPSISHLPTAPMSSHELEARLERAGLSGPPPSREAPRRPRRSSTPPPPSAALDPTPSGASYAPVPLAHAPRRFVATSSDWLDERAGAPVARDVSPPVSAAPPAPPRSSARPAAPPAGDVRGSLVIATRDRMKETLADDELDRVRQHVGEGGAMDALVLPVAWVESGMLEGLLTELERARSLEAVRAVGRAVAEREIPRTHALLVRRRDPSVALARLPGVWRSYAQGAALRLEESGTGSWRLRVESGPRSRRALLFLAGFTEALLELCGAREVRASVVQSTGDEAGTLVIRWR